MSDDDGITTPPEGAQTFSADYVSKLRDEAAQHRTKANEFKNQATSLASQLETVTTAFKTEKDQLQSGLTQQQLAVTKIQAAISAGVPTEKLLDFADLLQGSDADSIAASAAKAQALLGITAPPPPATDTTQGSGNLPGSTPGGQDPILAKLRQIVGPPRQ